jgi:hypothetical protein
MILLADPLWISLLLLSSARAKWLYLVTLLLPAGKPVEFTFWEDSQEGKKPPLLFCPNM